VLYPFTFHPIFKERVWGGRNLERLYGKRLPTGKSIGESWEISDRPGDASVIANGPLAGQDLRWLMEHHAGELLGEARALNGRFPLLIKLLDAQEKLSLQVHPPAARAAALHGEPKTELWHVADAAAGAELFVGLKRGVTRTEFERRICDGSVADCFHRVGVRRGETMFLPSGRVHAIGAGLVIFEIQQNSDTTYRVFDWNRVDLDGRPRELHVSESLASIDFTDFEPGTVNNPEASGPSFKSQLLVEDPLFSASLFHVQTPSPILWRRPRMRILGVVAGRITVTSSHQEPAVTLPPGAFCLVPAGLEVVELRPETGSVFLQVEAG